jgi:hypothetical protein
MHKVIEYVDDSDNERQTESWQSKRIEQYVSIDTASGPILVRSSAIDEAVSRPATGNSPDIHNEQKLFQRQQADKEFQTFREAVNESVKTVPAIVSEQTITDLRAPIYSNITSDDVPTALHVKCVKRNDMSEDTLFDWQNQTYVHLESMPPELRDVVVAYTRLLVMNDIAVRIGSKNVYFEKLTVAVDNFRQAIQSLNRAHDLHEYATLDEIYEQCGVR